jgi:Tol biopolymer transport system component
VTAEVATGTAKAVAAANATVTAVALASERAPTDLPATWTPSPVATQQPEALVFPTAVSSAAAGTVFFIFNHESVAALSVNNGSENLIVIGGTPADLALSPDGQYLAYVAQSGEGQREVFISRLNGTNVQQVSCLRFARVADPTWSPDSQTIAFTASTTQDDAAGIYTAGVQNTAQCPFGNQQRLLVQTGANLVDSLSWSSDGSKLFFATDAIYAIDVTPVRLYAALTAPTGFGPDFSPAFQPGSNALFYLKTERDDKTGKSGGILSQVNTADLGSLPLSELRTTLLYAVNIRWSRDGRYLLSATTEDVLVQDMKAGTANSIVLKSKFPPQPIFSPDAAMIAYVDAGEGPDNIPQIYLVGRNGNNRRQITFHRGGTVSDLNWAASG